MSVSTNPPKFARTAEFAWPGGDAPGRIEFNHPVGAELKDRILQRLCELMPGQRADGAEIRAMAPPNGSIGRYGVTTPTGEWFVRISGRWAEPKLEQALSRFLRDSGVPVNALEVAGEPFEADGYTLRFDVRPLLSARHFDGSREDLSQIAAALGKCHRALIHFSRAEEVRQLSAKRFGRLVETLSRMRDLLHRREWSAFAKDPEWAKSRRDWLAGMLAEFNPRFDEDKGAQTLHAQIHRGNVVFLADGSPVLVDLEEAVHTYAPPEWDIAHLVQRFCLFDSPSPAILADRLAVIAKTYGAAYHGLAKMMRRIAWLSIAILVQDHLLDDAGAPTSEYEKFTRLEQQARELEGQLP
jgi:hypothetical protein